MHASARRHASISGNSGAHRSLQQRRVDPVLRGNTGLAALQGLAHEPRHLAGHQVRYQPISAMYVRGAVALGILLRIACAQRIVRRSPSCAKRRMPPVRPRSRPSRTPSFKPGSASAISVPSRRCSWSSAANSCRTRRSPGLRSMPPSTARRHRWHDGVDGSRLQTRRRARYRIFGSVSPSGRVRLAFE